MLALLLLLTVPPSASGADAGPHLADVQVRIETAPTGLSVDLDGVRRPTPYSFLCAQDTVHVLNATPVTPFPFVRYLFTGWLDGDASRTRTFVCDVAKNFTALHRTEYRMRIDTAPARLRLAVNGSLSAAPVEVWCPEGATLGVSAPDVQGSGGYQYLFGNWSDGGQATHAVPCDAPRNATASYRTQYLIGVFTEPSELAVSVDGVTFASPYTFWCDAFASHTLGAPLDQSFGPTQYRFDHWIDGELPGARQITCIEPMNYSAVFIPTPTPPVVDGTGPIAWGVLVALALLTVVPFVVAGVAFALRRRPPTVPIPVPPPAGAAPSPRPAPAPPGFCRRCGAAAEPDWTYCMACGSGLKTT